MYKKLLPITILLFAAVGMQAQNNEKNAKAGEKTDIPFYFRFDSDEVDPEYKDNRSSLAKASMLVNDASIRIDSMTMVATSSPEGSVSYNEALATRRVNAMRSYFIDNFPAFRGNIFTSTSLYTWQDLAEEIKNDENVPHRKYVLDVLAKNTNTLRMPSRLKAIDGGEAYKYLEENYLSKMRSAANALVYYIPDLEPAPEPEPIVEFVDTTPRYITQRIAYPVLALRTNFLCPLTNFGVILPIGNRWSVAADWYTPWLFRKNDHKFAFQFQALNLEGRMWFGKKHTADLDNRVHRLTGHSVGVYLYGGKYDMERNWKGHQGEFFSTGVDYLYAIPAWKNRIRWEFEIAFGYLHNQSHAYDVYEPGGELITRAAHPKYFNYAGPTKAAISLVIPIFAHYNKTVKEEVR